MSALGVLAMKRWLIAGVTCVMFGAALLTGYGAGLSVGSREGTTATAVSAVFQEEEYAIEKFRTERQQLRQMQISQLNELIYGGKADAAVISAAQQKLLEIMEWNEQELTIEGVLQLRNFEDALATVHSDSVNVINLSTLCGDAKIAPTPATNTPATISA